MGFDLQSCRSSASLKPLHDHVVDLHLEAAWLRNMIICKEGSSSLQFPEILDHHAVSYTEDKEDKGD